MFPPILVFFINYGLWATLPIGSSVMYNFFLSCNLNRLKFLKKERLLEWFVVVWWQKEKKRIKTGSIRFDRWFVVVFPLVDFRFYLSKLTRIATISLLAVFMFQKRNTQRLNKDKNGTQFTNDRTIGTLTNVVPHLFFLIDYFSLKNWKTWSGILLLLIGIVWKWIKQDRKISSR